MSTYRNSGFFLLLSLLWGASFMAIKVGLEYIPPVLFAAFRYDIAGLILLGYVVVATEYWRPRTRSDWLAVIVSATLVIALYNAFLFIGEQGVTSGVAAILIAMNPIFATVLSRALLPDERLDLAGVIGLLAGIGGVILVAQPTVSDPFGADIVYVGLVLSAAVCVAAGSVLVQRIDGSIATESMTAWSNVLGAVMLHAISFGLPSESFGQIEITTELVLAVGYLAILASALGYGIYFDLLDRLGAIEINFVSYAVPVFAAITGWLVLGETLHVLSIIGFVVILIGFVLLKRTTIRDKLTAASSQQY